MSVAVVALGSNDPGCVPIAAVAPSSNGPTMSMRLLLCWVTDKRADYETIYHGFSQVRRIEAANI
jgi:hypothetical protein